MDLRRLEAFLAIVDEGTFAAAADALGTVQSSVSASIRALERDLGVPLFDRSRRAATLTAAGRALVPEARDLLRRAALTRRLVKDASTQLHGELRLGTISPTYPVPLPRILQRFTAAHPHVTLRVMSDPVGTQGLLERLGRSDLDLAIVAGPLPQRPAAEQLVAAQLAAGDLVCIVAADDPLAARGRIGLADIAARAWVESPVGQVNRATTDGAFAAAHLERTVAVEIWDPADVPNYVAAGAGVAVVPEFLARDRTDVRMLRVSEVQLRWSTALVRLPQRSSELIEAFWQAATQATETGIPEPAGHGTPTGPGGPRH